MNREISQKEWTLFILAKASSFWIFVSAFAISDKVHFWTRGIIVQFPSRRCTMIPEKVLAILKANDLKFYEFPEGTTPTATTAAQMLKVKVGQ